MKLSASFFAAATVLLGLATTASAGFVPVFQSAATSSNSTVFTYSVNFTTNGTTESLTDGDFFTLYDIGSLGNSAGNFDSVGISGAYGFSLATTGETPAFVTPPDSPLIGNLTLTYQGSTLTTNTTFNLEVTYVGVVGTTTGYYSSTDTASIGKNAQVGEAVLPLQSVPEPSTWGMLGLGVMGAGVVALRRRQRAA